MLLITVTVTLLALSVSAQDNKGSKDNFLKSKVKYSAKDSMWFNIEEEKVYLYGNAEMTYEEIKLNADYIELDLGNSTLFASGSTDSITGKTKGDPVFSDVSGKFEAKALSYNFNTRKGRIQEVITNEGEGYIHGETVKKDTGNTYYVAGGKYTTCNNKENPHFYISAGKIKVMQNDKIITGPAYLVVEKIPTPLALPFGYFPNRKGQRSGIIIPSYGESQGLGFFLKDGGYYFGINDYIDLAIKGDIYSRGSWAARTVSSYKKRYKYNGNLSLNYSKIATGDIDINPTIRKDFFVRWNHNQDPKAKPKSQFIANVNAGSSQYNIFNSYNPNQYLANTFQSNIAYSKQLGNTFYFSSNLRHSQNTINKQVDLSLPELALNMNRIYPFKSKNSVGSKWYHKIGISYSGNASNIISSADSLLFRKETLDKMRYGLKHSVPLTTSINLLKHFTFTPTLTGSSTWYFDKVKKNWDGTTDSLMTDTIKEFSLLNEYNFNSSLTTRIYGHYAFLHPEKMTIRHLMIPIAGYSYRPDYSNKSKFNYYDEVQTDSIGTLQKYSYYQNGIYGTPSGGKSSLINFGLNNTFEMKVRSKNDSATSYKKITLLEAFNISGFYNVAADSFKLSHIAMNARTNLFKKININTGTTLDPYAVDSTGRRIGDTVFVWNVNPYSIGRITSAFISVGTSINGGNKKKKAQPSPQQNDGDIEFYKTYPNAYVDFSIPWSLNIFYNLNYSKPLNKELITQSLTFSGDINFTEKWKVGFNSGYDFITHKLTYTQFNIYRDLHCWEMRFSWVPFGFRQSYMININVKASILQDLKLTRKRDWYDYLQ